MTTQQSTGSIYRESVIEKSDYQPVFKFADIRCNDGVTGQRPCIFLQKEGAGSIILHDKPFSRFLSFLGIGKRAFMRQMYEDANVQTRVGMRVRKVFIGADRARAILADLYAKNTTKSFKLLSVNGDVVRLTSEDYIGVRHTFVQDVIENRLKAEGIEYTKETKFMGVSGMYTFKNTTGDEMTKSIWYVNRNSGDKSLKIFGGAMVLVCTNGLISKKVSSEMRIVHKLEESEVRKRIEQALGAVLEKVKFVSQEFLKLRQYKVTTDEAKVLIESLKIPKYLQTAIWARLFQDSTQTRNGHMDWDGTVYGIYMASTYIASHASEIQRSKNITKKMDEDIVESLSTLEMFTEMWDQREKILSASTEPVLKLQQ